TGPRPGNNPPPPGCSPGQPWTSRFGYGSPIPAGAVTAPRCGILLLGSRFDAQVNALAAKEPEYCGKKAEHDEKEQDKASFADQNPDTPLVSPPASDYAQLPHEPDRPGHDRQLPAWQGKLTVQAVPDLAGFPTRAPHVWQPHELPDLCSKLGHYRPVSGFP